MTLPSRKKRQTTVPNSQVRRTTNRRTKYAGVHAWPAAIVLGGIVSGLGTPLTIQAQQTPAWSPQPFERPQGQSQSKELPTPRNSLRTPQSEEPNVIRWKGVNANPSSLKESKSYGQTLQTATTSPSAAPVSQTVIKQPRETSVAESQTYSEPRSSFGLASPMRKSEEIAVLKASEVQPAGYAATPNESAVKSSVKSAVSSTVASNSNGVWYDRTSGNIAAEHSRIEIGPASGGEPKRKQSPAPNPTSYIQRARYQIDSQDGRLNFDPTLLPQALESTQNGKEPAPRENALNDSLPEAEPPRLQPAPKKQSRSLMDQEEVPSPFPRSKTPKEENETSPSDTTSKLDNRKNLDRAPAPPKKMIANCDSVRQMISDANIRDIRIDSSPSFVEGYKTRGGNNTKDAFTKSAPIRSWTGLDGNPIVDAKLVDLAYGEVVLERADGSRMSVLLRKLSEPDQVYIGEKWGLPVTCAVDDGSFPSRNFTDTSVTWKATGACHKPLYFEEVQLERYGHEWGPFAQPVISSAHFFGNVAVLPYKMGIHPMNECQYALGYYRPGSCAPWTVGPVPISLRGALMQAKFVTGAALAIP